MMYEIDTPQFKKLKLLVEIKFGFKLQSPRYFTKLSEEITTATKIYVSDSTLMRLWGYKRGYTTATPWAMDALSLYVGCGTYNKFLEDDALCRD